MCTNYAPPSRDALRAHFDVSAPAGDWKPEVWRGYAAPIIRRAEDGSRVAELGHFGLVPPWIRSAADAKKISAGTMNARSETVGEKPSFRQAWRKGHFCLVPMARFFEPDWRSGHAIRSAISLSDGVDFGVAGIWSWWRDPASDPASDVVGDVAGDSAAEGAADGRSQAPKFTFSLLTINADAHPVMNQLHRPGDEKRSLVIVPRADWGHWLSASTELARALLVPYPARELRLIAAPLPPRPSRASASRADPPA